MKSAVVVSDMSGRIRVVNRGAEHPARVRARRVARRAPARHPGARVQNLTTGQLLNSMGVLEHPMVWRSADGTRVDVLAASSFLRDDDGVPVAVVYVANDFTERKRAEQALRESEQRYRTLFEMNPLPMWVYDLDTLRFTAVNDAAVAHYGFSREEFLGLDHRRHPPAGGDPGHAGRIARSRRAPRTAPLPPSQQGRHRHRRRRHLLRVCLRRTPSRLVIAQDITERKRADEARKTSEARYRLLFERNLAGVFRTDADGHILDCNDACARIFGFESREEFFAADANDLLLRRQASAQRVVQMLREQRQLSNLELRLRRRDGSAVWVLENVSLLEGEILEGTIIDITDRKHAQEQMEYQAYHDSLTLSAQPPAVPRPHHHRAGAREARTRAPAR